MLGFGQVAWKDSGMGAGKGHVDPTERLSSVLCCVSLSQSHKNHILLPTEEKLQVCQLLSHFSFLEILEMVKMYHWKKLEPMLSEGSMEVVIYFLNILPLQQLLLLFLLPSLQNQRERAF